MVLKRKSRNVNIKENKQLSHIEEIVSILDKSGYPIIVVGFN